MSKKVKNDEQWPYIAENRLIDEKWEQILFFGFFSRIYGKMSKKVKHDEKGHILLKKAQIDEKGEK